MTHPLQTIFPAVALGVTVLGINIFGDGLRDMLDPRMRGAAGRSR
jgi:peptide/nickel transport system permease protein